LKTLTPGNSGSHALVFAGSQRDAIVEMLSTIVKANHELAAFHQGRVV
jgi:hypothetical protein